MVAFPHAKINLGLRVLSRRPDGYHNIETSFYPVPWTDVLEILPHTTQEFVQTGLSIPGSPDENLCVKAYQVLKKDFDLSPVRIHLHKIIPPGAGLGGGSSDAAFALRLLNHVFDLKLSPASLSNYAARIGSDCAFFTQDSPMIGTGRGEILNPIALNLHGRYLVLVIPKIHISTAEAYKHVTPLQPVDSLHSILEKHPENWKEEIKNDFEVSVFQQYPVLRDIKRELYVKGASYASMSGSGSTLFGIFEKEVEWRGRFKDDLCWSGWL